ncbi:MAG: MotE family protein [Roseburia sp.]
MAGENEEVFDKKAAKKAEKARKKREKKKTKAEREELDLDEESSVGGKIAVFFVTLIIILIWLAIIGLLIKWDVGGFGSTVLGPMLKDVPYVNRILPDTVTEVMSTEDSAYAFASMEEAVERIKQLEIQLAEAQNASTADAEYITQLEGQSAELARYRQEEANFEDEKMRFYQDVVFSDSAPDIEAYKTFYESIDPANAEMLYRQVVGQIAVDDKVKEYVKTYASMKPKEAAAMFDTMTDDLQLVAQILENMDAQSRANILGKMNPSTAAKVTAILEPSE